MHVDGANCNHSTVYPSTSSPDRLQTSRAGGLEHQSGIPCDSSLPPYPVLRVLFHPEYSPAKKAVVCRMGKTWEWKILAWPSGMVPDSS